MTVHVLPQQATTMGCVYRSSSRGLESPRQFVVGRALAWRRAVTVSWRAHGHVDVRGRCVVQKVGVKGGGFGGARAAPAVSGCGAASGGHVAGATASASAVTSTAMAMAAAAAARRKTAPCGSAGTAARCHGRWQAGGRWRGGGMGRGRRRHRGIVFARCPPRIRVCVWNRTTRTDQGPSLTSKRLSTRGGQWTRQHTVESNNGELPIQKYRKGSTCLNA